VISITNDQKAAEGRRRRTKNRRDRILPISPQLLPVLQGLQRHPDGVVFHGPLGGALKADTVRNNLIDGVLPHVGRDLRGRGVETRVDKGRLHSFRHYFCSECANNSVPMQMVMDWLGHQDSRMVRYYYHLTDKRSQEEMARLRFVGGDGGQEDRSGMDKV